MLIYKSYDIQLLIIPKFRYPFRYKAIPFHYKAMGDLVNTGIFDAKNRLILGIKACIINLWPRLLVFSSYNIQLLIIPKFWYPFRYKATPFR